MIVLQFIFQINNNICENGLGKVEICKGAKVYLEEARFNIINMNLTNSGCWRKAFQEILVEIYGEFLKFMCAKGTRGSVGIHPAVYKAVFSKFKFSLSN